MHQVGQGGRKKTAESRKQKAVNYLGGEGERGKETGNRKQETGKSSWR